MELATAQASSASLAAAGFVEPIVAALAREGVEQRLGEFGGYPSEDGGA